MAKKVLKGQNLPRPLASYDPVQPDTCWPSQQQLGFFFTELEVRDLCHSSDLFCDFVQCILNNSTLQLQQMFFDNSVSISVGCDMVSGQHYMGTVSVRDLGG